MESQTDDIAARLLRCPVGCAFLLTIARDKIPVADAITPRQAFARAAVALNELNPWSPLFERAVPAALSRGADLVHLAHEVAAHPASRWWSAPLDRARQVLVVDDTVYPAPARAAPSRRVLTRLFGRLKRPASRDTPPQSNIHWEDYAQRPESWRLTSTLHEGYACVDTVIAHGVGDWPSPDAQRRFVAVIEESARVYEISGPAGWHALCVSYPRVNEHPNSPAGVGTLSPDWRRVATEWDGVHLTLMGLLTAPFVRHSTAAGTTMLWSWDTEGTMWLPGEFLRPSAPLPSLSERDARAFDAITAPLMDDDLGIPQWPPVPGVKRYHL